MARTRGPLAEMLLEGGFSPEATRRVVHFFTRRLNAEMTWAVGQDVLDQEECRAEQTIQRAGGEITFQVQVFSSNKDFHKKHGSSDPEFESLTDVMAHTAEEARLVASQMAACKRTDPMPLWSEVITDSTLTCF